MERRMTRFFKIAIAIIVMLTFGIIGGLLTTVSAAASSENTAVIETDVNTKYTFAPDGYYVGSGKIVPHTGAYLIFGNANTDIEFTSENGEDVTYDVILHSWNAVAQSWNGLMSVEKGVTLNITVYGESIVKGHNHAGIKLNNGHEVGNDPVVNITVMENSSITFGYQYQQQDAKCVGDEIVINLSEGTEASLDMTSDDWRSEKEITFSKGTEASHKMSYTYVDDETCLRSCSDCDLIKSNLKHDAIVMIFEEGDEKYTTKHFKKCDKCGHEFGEFDHEMEYVACGTWHVAVCNVCDYERDDATHTVVENRCTVCEAAMQAVVSNGDTDVYYDDVTQALDDADNAEGSTVRLLSDASFSWAGINGSVILDLNGHTLTSENDRIYVYGDLTVTDTSPEQTGRMLSSGEQSYIFEASYGGKLTVNSGEIFGYIYALGEGSTIEINGGKLTGKEKFRLEAGTTLIINGGWFENEEGTIYYWSTGGINVTINGGTFANGRVIHKNSYKIPTQEEILGKSGDCELAFLFENGNEVVLEGLDSYIDGIASVAHRGATPVKNQDGHALSCPVCEKQMGLIKHHSTECVSIGDNAGHVVICGVCKYEQTQAHTGGKATCTEKAVCEHCEEPYGNETGHVYANACDTDCDECDETREISHSFGEDGKCTVCGEDDPNYTPPTTGGSTAGGEENNQNGNQNENENGGGLGVGAIIGIVIGSLAVLGGGFALWWFVFRKKRII